MTRLSIQLDYEVESVLDIATTYDRLLSWLRSAQHPEVEAKYTDTIAIIVRHLANLERKLRLTSDRGTYNLVWEEGLATFVMLWTEQQSPGQEVERALYRETWAVLFRLREEQTKIREKYERTA